MFMKMFEIVVTFKNKDVLYRRPVFSKVNGLKKTKINIEKYENMLFVAPIFWCVTYVHFRRQFYKFL